MFGTRDRLFVGHHHLIGILDVLFQLLQGLSLAEDAGDLPQSTYVPTFVDPILECKMPQYGRTPSDPKLPILLDWLLVRLVSTDFGATFVSPMILLGCERDVKAISQG